MWLFLLMIFWFTLKAVRSHEQHLRIVLQNLRDNKLYAKLKKCKFLLDKVSFLGHVISKEGISVDLGKVKAIIRWSRPNMVIFFTLAGSYRHFIEEFSKISKPSTKHTHKSVKFVSANDCEKSFQELKNR